MSLTGYNVSNTISFDSGVYHHVALTISGNTHIVYLDGSAVATNSSAGNVFNSYNAIQQIYIGCAGDLSYGFTGYIDDFKIFNRALPIADISAIYYSVFTLRSIGNLSLWLDAQTTSSIDLSNNGKVYKWYDKNNNSNFAINEGGAGNITRGTHAYSTYPFINLAGRTVLLVTNASTNFLYNPTKISYFTVFKLNSGTTNIFIPANGSIDPGFGRGINLQITVNNDNTIGIGAYGGNNGFNIKTNAISTTTVNILTLVVDRTVPSSLVLNINGTRSVSATNTFNAGYSGYTNTAGGMIGDSGGGSGIYIGEKIIYNNTILSVNYYQKVEGYLAWKWGLQGSLPTSHPYYTASP